MTTIQTVYLRQTEYGVPPVVHAVQNDTGRELRMVILDQTLPVDATAELAIKRSDGSYYNILCGLESETSSFICDLTQALTQSGKTECQLKVEGLVSTYVFVLDVQADVSSPDEVVEQMGYTVQDIIDAADQIWNGVSYALKSALLQLASKVAYIDEHGQEYYNDLLDALSPTAVLVSITADYLQSGEVLDTASLDSLRSNLVVTAHYSTGQDVIITTYTLSGSLVAGISSILVTFDNKYTRFNVVVTHDTGYVSVVNNLVNSTSNNPATILAYGTSYSANVTANEEYTLTGASVLVTMGNIDITESAYSNGTITVAEVTDTLRIQIAAVALVLENITAVYTQSGTVYNNDSLDSLKADLVVTAHYTNGESATVDDSNYTLSGNLSVGESIITVNYREKTTTFSVTVTSRVPILYMLPEETVFSGSSINTNLDLINYIGDGISIVFDIEDDSSITGEGRVFWWNNNSTPYMGINVTANKTGQVAKGYNYCSYRGSTEAIVLPNLSGADAVGAGHRIKCVITARNLNGYQFTLDYSIDGVRQTQLTQSMTSQSFATAILYIGGRSSSDYWKGTMYNFIVYGEVIDSNFIDNILSE